MPIDTSGADAPTTEQGIGPGHQLIEHLLGPIPLHPERTLGRLDEDARELIGEWQRWQTLKRFRLMGERIAAMNPQIKTFKKEFYLRPVMNQELLLIDNADDYQNDGYK